MMEAYDGEPDNFGIIVIEKETAYEYIHRASMSGFPSVVHAIGDRAVRDILDVYQRVRADEAAAGIARNTRRHRIEHVQLIHPEDVGRLASLDLIASMQPIHATSDYPIADQFWGARTPYSYNPRLQLDRGVRVIFGSDSPCDRLGIMLGVHAAVTRRRADGSPGEHGWNPAARTTIDEALRAYTVNPAYTAGLDDRLGRLSVGYLADLVVLDHDPYETVSDPMALLDIGVVGTMVGGQWRYGDFSERV